MAEVGRGAAVAATLAAALPWMALALLACLGLAQAPPGPARRLVLGLVLALLAVHALTFGMSRFRLPAVPFLAAYAGVGAAALGSGRWLPQGRWRRLALLAAVVGLAWLWGLRLGPLLDFKPLQLP
jgi:hypothetical protein